MGERCLGVNFHQVERKRGFSVERKRIVRDPKR